MPPSEWFRDGTVTSLFLEREPLRVPGPGDPLEPGREQEAGTARDPTPLQQLCLCPPLTLGQGARETQRARGSPPRAPAQAAQRTPKKGTRWTRGSGLPSPWRPTRPSGFRLCVMPFPRALGRWGVPPQPPLTSPHPSTWPRWAREGLTLGREGQPGWVPCGCPLLRTAWWGSGAP